MFKYIFPDRVLRVCLILWELVRWVRRRILFLCTLTSNSVDNLKWNFSNSFCISNCFRTSFCNSKLWEQLRTKCSCKISWEELMTHLCCRIYLTWTTSNSSLRWCSIHSFSGLSSLTTSLWPVFRPHLIQPIQSLGALGVFRPPRYLWITTRPLSSNLPH